MQKVARVTSQLVDLHQDEHRQKANVNFPSECAFEAGTLLWREVAYELRRLAFGAGFRRRCFERCVGDMVGILLLH